MIKWWDLTRISSLLLSAYVAQFYLDYKFNSVLVTTGILDYALAGHGWLERGPFFRVP